MRIQTIPLGPLQANCYLVVDEDAGDLVVVDPGDDAPRLLAAIAALGLPVQAVWLTHAHFDHVGALAPLIAAFPDAGIHLHPADAVLYVVAARQAASFGLRISDPPPYDHELGEGDVVSVGTQQFRVWHCPGHAPGHVIFVGEGVAIVGDCLFAGSVGRTDLPYADAAQLSESLDRIAMLPPETRVLCGHGPETTIGVERLSNPFLNGAARLVTR